MRRCEVRWGAGGHYSLSQPCGEGEIKLFMFFYLLKSSIGKKVVKWTERWSVLSLYYCSPVSRHLLYWIILIRSQIHHITISLSLGPPESLSNWMICRFPCSPSSRPRWTLSTARYTRAPADASPGPWLAVCRAPWTGGEATTWWTTASTCRSPRPPSPGWTTRTWRRDRWPPWRPGWGSARCTTILQRSKWEWGQSSVLQTCQGNNYAETVKLLYFSLIWLKISRANRY